MYNIVYRVLLWSVAFLLLCNGHATAALKAKDSTTPQEAWNPLPAEDDIILPMPCGAQMVFKLVGVPAKGVLQDMSTRLGRDDGENSDRAYYDGRYTAVLSAPFTRADLPAAWQNFAPKGDYQYYLIEKYELSSLQWDCIMAPSCPDMQKLGPDAARPKTEISWYDATAFAQRYTNWLLKEHPDSLPHFSQDTKNTGFIRLPTETEWEYAARGGHKTPSQWMAQEDFFPLPEGVQLTDYAVFRPEDASRLEESPQRLGSRKPNPVGLFDTAGNVAEMVLDSFRFSLGGRLHGSAGGFVRKGGSYLNGTAEIMPGRREEVAFFQQNGEVKTLDMGVRLVISGINTPAGNRPETLRAEWQRAGEDFALQADGASNPLDSLDKLISLARNDAERKNLQQLRNVLKDNNIALERQQQQNAESLVRTTIFMIESVRNFDKRLILLDFLQKKNLLGTSSDVRHTKDNLTDAKRQAIGLYYAKLQDIRIYPPALLDEALQKVENELHSSTQSKFDTRLLSNLRIYKSHIAAVRKGQSPTVSRITTDLLKND